MMVQSRETPNSDRQRPRPVTALAIGLLRLYQWTLSPLFAAIGVRCRHLPTCSHYGVEAFRRHGAWRGFWLTASRLLRCHPLGTHGFDPVPPQLGQHRWHPWRYGRWSWRRLPGEGPAEKNQP